MPFLTRNAPVKMLKNVSKLMQTADHAGDYGSLSNGQQDGEDDNGGDESSSSEQTPIAHPQSCHDINELVSLPKVDRRSPRNPNKQNTKYSPIKRLTSEEDEVPVVVEQSKYRLMFRLIHDLLHPSERRLFYLSLFLCLLLGVCRLFSFLFIGHIIDTLADSYDGQFDGLCPGITWMVDIDCSSDRQLLQMLIVSLAVLCALGTLINFGVTMLGNMVICSSLRRLNTQIFDTIILQNLSFFDVTDSRDLRYLFSSDLKYIRCSIGDMIGMNENAVHFLFGFFYLALINWQIALIVFGYFSFLTLSSAVYIRWNAENEKKRKSAFKMCSVGIQEMLSYMATIKAFGKEGDECFIYKQAVHRAFECQNETNLYLYGYRCALNLCWIGATIGIIWYRASIIYDSTESADDDDDDDGMTIGVLIIDLMIFLQLNASVYRIVTLYPSAIGKASKAVSRVLHVMDIGSDHHHGDYNDGDHYDSRSPHLNGNYIPENDEIVGDIEMKSVSFCYPNYANRFVLNAVSLSFGAKEKTALVGVSGSGKSTMMKLLMRFYEAQSGSILVDGVPIEDYNLGFLKSQIGFVGQNVHLFQGRTVAENIKFGIKMDKKDEDKFDAECFDEEKLYFWRRYKGISDDDVESAAKIANAHEFIMDLQHGYWTKIGGKTGIQLSAGEMQRIAIARAVLMNPRILLLDEAMSNVDSISKQLIKESLDRIMEGRCVVVIPHRLKTVKNADRIYVVHKGNVVESGKHDELMQIEHGHYAQFIRTQRFE